MSKKSMHSGFGTVLRAAAAAMLVAGLAAGAAVAQERVYVANAQDNTLSVIDPSTNTQVALGASLVNTLGLAASPDGRRVYVANTNDIAIVDTTINAIIGTVPAPQRTGAIAVNPNGKLAYTVPPGGAPFLTVLSTGFIPAVVKEVFLNAVPGGLTLSPDSGRLYITDLFGGSLIVMDTSTYRSFAIPVNPFPGYVAAHPDGARVYVAHADFDALTVVDFGAGTLTTVPMSNPGELVITPDGSRVYVTNGADDTVTAIDAATNTAVATIPVGDAPQRIAVSADGAFVYATNQNSDDVSVISTATNTVVATVPVGDVPFPVVYVVRRGPGSKGECMNGGWQNFTNPSFNNQGECIAFYNSIH